DWVLSFLQVFGLIINDPPEPGVGRSMSGSGWASSAPAGATPPPKPAERASAAVSATMARFRKRFMPLKLQHPQITVVIELTSCLFSPGVVARCLSLAVRPGRRCWSPPSPRPPCRGWSPPLAPRPLLVRARPGRPAAPTQQPPWDPVAALRVLLPPLG